MNWCIAKRPRKDPPRQGRGQQQHLQPPTLPLRVLPGPLGAAPVCGQHQPGATQVTAGAEWRDCSDCGDRRLPRRAGKPIEGPFRWWSAKRARLDPMGQERGSSIICSPPPCLCGSFLARLALHQGVVSITMAQHKLQQGQNGISVATAAMGGCLDEQASLHEGNMSARDTAMLGMVRAR